MLTLTGKLLNVLDRPARTTKDGRAWGGDCQIQVLASETLDNGEVKNVLVDLAPVDRAAFAGKEGKDVSIPVRAYAAGGVVRYQVLEPILAPANSAKP